MKLKGRCYKTVLRTAVMYESECKAGKQGKEQRMQVAEMSEVFCTDRIRKDHIGEGGASD